MCACRFLPMRKTRGYFVQNMRLFQSEQAGIRITTTACSFSLELKSGNYGHQKKTYVHGKLERINYLCRKSVLKQNCK